jgi:hypothetical protein
MAFLALNGYPSIAVLAVVPEESGLAACRTFYL